MKWKEPTPRVAVCLLAALTVGCLLPFLGKAIHMDDPLFVWTARQIKSHPFDFYGFSVVWNYQPKPVWLEMQNPPLAAYYMAAVGMAFGWSERALHFGFLGPALALVTGTYWLGRKFCSCPCAAALAVVVMPVFVLSSSSLTCDTMMVALWVWAMFFWMEGLEKASRPQLFAATVLITACWLTKYFGLCLIPLLAAYSIFKQRRVGWWLLYFALPLVVLCVYQILTAHFYRRGLLWNALQCLSTERTPAGNSSRMLETLAFCGGCLFVALPALPMLWGRKGLAAGAAAAVAAGCLMATMKKVGLFAVVHAGHVEWLFLLQMALLVTGGGVVVALAVAEVMRSRAAESLLLALWTGGVLVFVAFVNWTISGRNLLPLAPAAALMIARRMETRGPGRFWWPAAISLALAMTVAWGDWNLAGQARDAARTLTLELRSYNGIGFEGHWGFQYYMQELGARPLDREQLVLRPNEAIVIPMKNTSLFPLPHDKTEPLGTMQGANPDWISLQDPDAGAGYYSDGWGPAPFMFGAFAPETYRILRVK